MINFNIKKNKNKIVLYSVFTFFFIFFLANFIASSFYNVDEKIASSMFITLTDRKAAFWSAYTIYDGAGVILTVLGIVIPLLIFILFEYISTSKPNHKLANLKNHKLVVYVVTFIIIFAIEIYSIYSLLGADHGFGKWFDYITLMDKTECITIFVVSIIVQMIMFVIGNYIIKIKLVDTKEMMNNGYARRISVMLIILAFAYIVILIFKSVFARPYYFNTRYGDMLNYLKENNIDKYKIYMSQSEFKWGFIDGKSNAPSNAEFPWWRVYTTNKYNKIEGQPIPWSDAFPSGHLTAVTITGLLFYIFYPKAYSNKKSSTISNVSLVIYCLYIFDMLFAMITTSGHWWSDMMFSGMIMGIYFMIITTIFRHTDLIWFKKIGNKILMIKN